MSAFAVLADDVSLTPEPRRAEASRRSRPGIVVHSVVCWQTGADPRLCLLSPYSGSREKPAPYCTYEQCSGFRSTGAGAAPVSSPDFLPDHDTRHAVCGSRQPCRGSRLDQIFASLPCARTSASVSSSMTSGMMGRSLVARAELVAAFAAPDHVAVARMGSS